MKIGIVTATKSEITPFLEHMADAAARKCALIDV